jgi:hypothetical protein
MLCIKIFLFTFLFISFIGKAVENVQRGKSILVILVILAHPDVEATVGPILAKYAEKTL